MSRTVTTTGTLTAIPSSYDSTDKSYYSLNSAANGYTDATSTTYAQMNWTRGSGAISYMYFKFNTSSIPASATNISASCNVKAYVSTANNKNVTTRQVQLFTGTTALGTAATVTTSVATYTLTASSLTRAQATDMRVRLYAVRGTSNTNSNYAHRFYGATLTLSYTYDQTIYTITASSSMSGVTVSPTSQECVEGDDASVTITGATNKTIVEDNGVNVTSSVSGGVYTITAVSADHVIAISESQGQSIYCKVNGSWVPVDAVYLKQNGTWNQVNTMYIKSNGTWKS